MASSAKPRTDIKGQWSLRLARHLLYHKSVPTPSNVEKSDASIKC